VKNSVQHVMSADDAVSLADAERVITASIDILKSLRDEIDTQLILAA
jgi:hypothetical protein